MENRLIGNSAMPKGQTPVAATGGTQEHDRFHAASLPMSLLRNAQKNGTASSVTHVLPMTCPTRNSREPKAKARKITESRTVPTRFDNIIAQSQNRFLRGVYTPKSASSENRNATPLARANCGETKAESVAPRSMATTTARRPSFSCVKSLKVKASPAKYTPAGAISPKPTGTTPKAAIAQLAAKIVAT